MSKQEPDLSSDTKIVALVEDFENGALPLTNWTHRAHLAVGAFYTRSMSLPAALVKMRQNIQQYNLINNNPTGYNETITRLFLARMTTDLRAGVTCRSLPDEIDRLSQLCSLGWLYENYSKELIHSPLAKREWVAPDLQQIDFLSGINWLDEPSHSD